MILDRLRVRGKLNLLLLLPLGAVVLVAVPFVTVQVGNARSAVATADSAHNARQLGALVWELQRERLITAGYLASPMADSVDLLLAQQAVDDTVEAVRASLGPGASDELTEALARVGSLAELRQGALQRGVSLDSVARAYHAVIEAIIQALRLVPQKTSDAEGTRQLTALNALLKANEESALRGMSLIAAAVIPQVGLALLSDSSAQAQMFTEQFVEQASPDQAALVVLVDQGEAARRVAALAERLPDARDRDAAEAFVADALAAVGSQASLRRVIQDRVIRQIADAAAGRADGATGVAWTVGLGTVALIVVVMALLVTVSRSIAKPLDRLTQAAKTVADLTNAELVRVTDEEGVHEQPLQLTAIELPTGDEIGELAVAFNQVQATASLLVERQTVTRRNVSLMFTNVAQRTRNLVGQQLAVVDELERDEQNVLLLSRLYRLDHLSTRLRRNAENLLVVAGARTEARVKGPTPLATVLRAALTEIEEYQRIRFGDICAVTISAAPASDLVLVFAELLENAAVFSPPESFVEVRADLLPHGACRVGIVDHGIGMTQQRMIQENRRLVERERLDIAPTSVLGLFVVGRLAKRHGLAVELAATRGGGTTAYVTIPAPLFSRGALPDPVALPRSAEASRAWAVEGSRFIGSRPAGEATRRVAVTAPHSRADGFSWFSNGHSGRSVAITARAAGETLVTDPMPADTSATGPLGFSRRVPGAQAPAAAARPPEAAPTARQPRDASAIHAAMDAYQAAVAPGAPRQQGAPPVGQPTLARRVPGANLAPGLRPQAAAAADPHRGGAWRARDPDAAREIFDAYSTGLAHGRQHTGASRPAATSHYNPPRENQ